MEYQIHELAYLFPKMSDDRFADLKADIEANGLLEPVTCLLYTSPSPRD